MLNCFLIISALLAIHTTLLAQTKEYKLIRKIENADFNYKLLNSIDTTRTRETRRKAFDPVKGKNTVYVFMAAFVGISFPNIEKEFHDILIIKADGKQKILDAYHYTLEWAEPPFSYDLYRASAKDLTLKNKLPIKSFNFRRVNYYKDTERELKEQGVLIR